MSKKEDRDGALVLSNLLKASSSSSPQNAFSAKPQSDSLSRLIQTSSIQTKLSIGKPNDRFEQEADKMAGRVSTTPLSIQQQPETEEEETPVQTQSYLQRQPEPEEEQTVQAKLMVRRQLEEEEEEPVQAKMMVQRQAEEEEVEETPVQAQTLLQRQAEEEEETVQTKSSVSMGNRVPSSIEGSIRSGKTDGTGMSKTVRGEMEGHFGTDFSKVRIHADSDAVMMNRALSAKAFTHGSHIYFGEGNYNPNTSAGKSLLAHELTHVVQQGAAVEKKPVSISSSPRKIQRLPGFITSRLNDYARHIPGYALLTVIIGTNPLTGRSVARTPENLLGGLMGLIPFGTALYDKLTELGIIGRAFSFVRAELERFDLSLERLERTIRTAYDEMDFIRWDPFEYNLGVLRRHLGALVSDVRGFASSIATQVLSMIQEALLGALRGVAQNIPDYSLFTKILGRDPLTGEFIEADTVQIIEDFLILIGQRNHLEKMRETGTIQRVATWIDTQLTMLNFSFAEIRDLFSEAWDAFSFRDVLNPIGAFNRTVNIFRPFVLRVFRFAYNVATAVLRFIKDALLSALTNFARAVPGFTLLTVILGRDPFTGNRVARNATNLIRGFMGFVPGGEEKFRNLQESGAIDRAFEWLNAEVETLDLNMSAIVGLFRRAWQSLSIGDLIDPVGAFRRMVDIFGPTVRRIINFAAAVGMKILEFIFEGVMGAGGARVLNILKRTRATFLTIIRDPIGFIGNLIRAAVQGFRQFGANILQHLQTGLVGWLFGALEGAGLQLPERFDLRGIISLVLQILGLTYERIRPRLVRLLGERTVTVLERTFEFVRLLATEGPAAVWQKIVEFAGNLRDRVMDAIKNWVITRIVTAAVTRLATMFNPVGAVVQAILAIYNTIMFFIERINQILAVVESFLDSISSIAAGAISAAANFVEQTMARTLPVVISVLARLIGLGGISNSIRRIIQRIRRPIDRAIDRVVAWIGRQASRLVRGARGLAARGARDIRNFVYPSESFTAGNERHSIGFSDNSANADVVVSSRPRTLTDLLNNLARMHENSSKQSQIRSARGHLSALSRFQNQLCAATSDSEKNRIKGQIRAKIREISRLLAVLMISEDFATENDPLLLTWPKPASANYPEIYLGPRSNQRIPQSTLRRAHGGSQSAITAVENKLTIAEKQNWAGKNKEIKEFRPHSSTTLPYHRAIGISSTYQVAAGKKIKLPSAPASSPGGRKLNSLLSHYGFHPSAENLDADHVVEIQVGGDDAVENLWPLNASINRRSGGQIARTNFRIDGDRRVPMGVLKQRAQSGNKEVWLEIAGTHG